MSDEKPDYSDMTFSSRNHPAVKIALEDAEAEVTDRTALDIETDAEDGEVPPRSVDVSHEWLLDSDRQSTHRYVIEITNEEQEEGDTSRTQNVSNDVRSWSEDDE